VKVRQNGRIVSVAVIVAVGVNSDGRREILGMDIGPSEAETFWTAFLRKLARRGLRGVKLVISDAHEGIKATVAKVLNATWQRCRVHCATSWRMPARAGGASSPPSSPPCPGRCRSGQDAVAQGRRPAPSQTAQARRLHG
jgi:putative transposase